MRVPWRGKEYLLKTHLDDPKTEERSTRRSGGKPTHSGLSLWLDQLRCKMTVRSWHRKTKKARRRHSLSRALNRIPHAHMIGDSLYMIGFWVEYVLVCFGRGVSKVCGAIARNVAALLLAIVRPFALGIITLCEDISEPFLVVAGGLRHIRDLSEQLADESAHQVRKEKVRYFVRGTRRYFPLVLNALSYVLPVAAAVVFVYVVQSGLNQTFVLNVQVNGESVGNVANEQVFESARADVQSRITNAENVMISTGAAVSDQSWEITPTYTLEAGSNTMTEGEVADAILRTSSNEITEATAVYVDGGLRFVTTEGDHLRTYLESVKAPYVDALDSSKRVSFVHDIQLVDGVYLLSSVVDYDNVIGSLNEGSDIGHYVAAEGDTVQTVLDTVGVSWDSLAALNPQLTSPDQELEEGADLITSVSSPEMLKVKEVVRSTYTAEIPYDTQTSESDQYDFGKIVTVQEGVNGTEEITQDITYIDGVEYGREVVGYRVVEEPVTQITVKGTKLKSGMVASIGSGNFMWPVPDYKYVTRWMSSYHKGADICAPYGTPIYASDSGEVVTAGSHWSYGNYVVINHGNGYKTLYAHMSKIAVSAGQGVERGQVIGYVGSTGDSTGNHCHFEMYGPNGRFSAQTLFPNMKTWGS